MKKKGLQTITITGKISDRYASHLDLLHRHWQLEITVV